MGDEGRDVGQGEVPVVSFNAAVADMTYELELTTAAQLVCPALDGVNTK